MKRKEGEKGSEQVQHEGILNSDGGEREGRFHRQTQKRRVKAQDVQACQSESMDREREHEDVKIGLILVIVRHCRDR